LTTKGRPSLSNFRASFGNQQLSEINEKRPEVAQKWALFINYNNNNKKKKKENKTMLSFFLF
jgi:hypothetical protein